LRKVGGYVWLLVRSLGCDCWLLERLRLQIQANDEGLDQEQAFDVEIRAEAMTID